MVENSRNSTSGIIFLFFIFVFFSFVHEGKERQIKRSTPSSSVISNSNNSGQAVIGTTISAPGINLFRTSTIIAKIACIGITSSREFIFNNLVSFSFSNCRLKFLFRNPIISFFFLQKVPEQGKKDDLPSLT